jgi:hypothetical protein
MTFFADLKREDLNIFRENLVESSYRLYLAHAMTPEERIIACDRDSHFLRVHIDYMPYSYLKKYEGKEAFKNLVGDQRNRGNAHFASILEQKFKEKLETKLKPANTIKLMFA